MQATRRKALLVGINDYRDAALAGCVEDARAMATRVGHNGDGTPNYFTSTLTSDDETHNFIGRADLRQALAELFENAEDHELLFYFAGHGAQTPWGAELVTQDYVAPYTYGVSLSDIATLANDSQAREVVVVLDCCFSGDIARQSGRPPHEASQQALLKQEVTLMAASRPMEPAWGSADHGHFTDVLLSGLDGAAADLLGNVTALGLHAFAVTAFAHAWDQQPVFKSHHAFTPVLRHTNPPIERNALLSIRTLFQEAESSYSLSPAHIGKRPIPSDDIATPEQVAFDQLSQLRSVGLLTIDAPTEDLGSAANLAADIRLSPLGRHYWKLASRDLI